MSKKIKVEFQVGTKYVGSSVEEVVEFEIEDDMTEKEIEEMIEEEFERWVWENIDSYWEIQE